MTAMMADLIDCIADEISVAGALNDNGSVAGLFSRLRSSGLLDVPQLVAALLRRAEEERLSEALRPGGASGKSRLLHALAADSSEPVAAAAMALVLGRSRRRDRFGGPRILLDDLPAEAACALVHSVAAAIGHDRSDHRSACEGAVAVFGRHDEGKRLEALCFALVQALESSGRLDESLLRSAVEEGEVAVFVEALARLGGIDLDSCWAKLEGAGGLALLLRIARIPRSLAAELIGSFGDVLGDGAGAEMEQFDALDENRANAARDRLRLDPHYRAALAALAD